MAHLLTKPGGDFQMSKKERKRSEKLGELPIIWHVDGTIVSKHATNLVIQSNPHEFVLSFFEAIPPIVLGSPAQVQEQISKMKGLEAECVARIIVAPGRFKEFVQILNNALLNAPDNSSKEGNKK
jgi:hypothetical protein